MPRVEQALSQEQLFDYAHQVWSTMLRRELSQVAEADEVPLRAPDALLYSAWCSLSGPEWQGSISLRCSARTAAELGKWFLDSSEPLREDELADCLGELCNVLGGNVKPVLPGGGLRLGLPAVVIGRDYEVHSPRGELVYELPCQAEGHRVDVILVQES